MCQKARRGFTLVELAIVLVIIGLVMGMVFKGRELLEGARVRSMAATASKLQAVSTIFFERYQAYPGDGCSVVQATSMAQCAGSVGAPRDGLASAAAERASIPSLLNSLGMTQDADWKSPFGLRWGVPPLEPWMVQGATSLAIINTPNDAALPAAPALGVIGVRYICALDRQIDDGDPTRGNVRSNATQYGAETVDCWGLDPAATAALAVRLYP